MERFETHFWVTTLEVVSEVHPVDYFPLMADSR